MTSRAARDIEDGREYEIYKDNQENGSDYSRGGRAPDLFGACSRREAFLASHARNHQSEYNALDQSCKDVAHEKRIACRRKIRPESVVGADHSKHASTKNSHEIGPYGQ